MDRHTTHPKTDIVVTIVGIPVVAVSRPRVVIVVVPRAAPDHTVLLTGHLTERLRAQQS